MEGKWMESPDEGRSGTRGWHSFSGSPWRRVPFVVGSWATKHRVSRVPLSFFPGFFPHRPVSRGHSHFATLSRNPSNVKGADIRAKGREQKRNRAQANCRSLHHRLGWKRTRHNGTGKVGVAAEKKGLLLSAHWPSFPDAIRVSQLVLSAATVDLEWKDTGTQWRPFPVKSSWSRGE